MSKSAIIISSAMISLCKILIVIFINQICAHQFVEIKIKQGFLKGIKLKTPKHNDIFAFMGIPYATPPTGQLRFKPPLPHPGWSNVLDATNFRSCCPQNDFKGNQLGEENCLFLNVFTPQINLFNNNVLYPVMIYIQAESFENGDSALYGVEKLVDFGVVVVTFNYRLGILGFLSTNDHAASGNWGLHDQKLVIEWVRANIETFSGDSNSITIFGQGAGAASVVYHLVSPLTNGLFHRAIAQSGSALCEWAIERAPLQYAKEVGFNAGCTTESTIDLVECLRKTPANKLLEIQSKGKIFGEFPQRAAPVVEKFGNFKFIPDHPRYLLEKGLFNRVPLMMGINSEETAYFYPLLLSNGREFRENPSFLENTFLQRFLDATTPFRDHLKHNEIKQLILSKYFNSLNQLNLTDLSMKFINMSSDALYLSCIDETLKLYSKHSVPSFMYLFAYRGHNSLVDLLVGNEPTLFNTGVCHGDELFYLFDLNIEGKKIPFPSDVRVEQRMLTLWTDFAKFGFAPLQINYEYPKWERFTTENPNYYLIGTELRPAYSYRQSEAYFWSYHLQNLFGFGPLVQSLFNSNRPVYKTLAWTMVIVSITLLLLIIILLAILYYQRRSQSFRAQPTDSSSRISGGSSNLY